MLHHERHYLELDAYYRDGTQEWVCPTCGRRLLFRANAAAKPVVLDPGNTGASHGEEQPEPTSATEVQTTYASGLSALWLEALAELDLSELPD
jgi:hypothetical protein